MLHNPPKAVFFMEMIEENETLKIYDWMFKLGLKGHTLIAYAAACKCKNENGFVDLNYVSEWCKCSKTHFENIVAKLERLKKKRPDLFHEIFDKDFVMKLIVEIGINGSENETDWESVKLFNKWIRDNLKDQVTEEDVWNSFLLLDKIGTKELICYIALWRCCFQKKVFVDLEKNPKLIQFFTSIRYWEIPIERKKRLFRVISGVKGSTKEILDDFMDTTDRELMYMALKKNFITVGLADEAIDWAIDRKKLELIPLLILKKHGEWPEEELFKENKHV